MGQFPLYNVQDYADKMPTGMAEKSGIFLTMYQREAMWIDFHAELPFAVKVFVGGINAISGLRKGEAAPDQDYMVVPCQPWLDGIACGNGKVRQFVARSKGSGTSVEAQTTGSDSTGGIQFEIVPIKPGPLPEQLEVCYKNSDGKEINRTLTLRENGIDSSSTWNDLKRVLKNEFDIAVDQQVLSPRVKWNHYLPIKDDAKISDHYFTPGFVLVVSSDVRNAAPPARGWFYRITHVLSFHNSIGSPIAIGEMSIGAGGLINQSIVRDSNPPSAYDKDAAIEVSVHLLDTFTFSAVTGKPAPPTPISAKTYADTGCPFFAIWGEEPSGVVGDFGKVQSIAQLEEARAKTDDAPYAKESSVAQRISVIGTFKSTFNPVGNP
ncbi:hypothetical protein F4777DRAFT_529622 [Nemania sp. FL0916]|nr:hypothetical protein F4777DRAFT_529622 [Nemania sp. FL0916]